MDVDSTVNAWAYIDLDWSGNVGIGMTSPAAKLQVNGDLRVGTGGSNGCLQNYAGNVIAGTCSSDARLKTAITPFAPMLSKVVQLQPVHYHWRSAEFPEYHFGGALNSGLVAQEVERVFPEMVGVDDHGYKTVNYSELPYLLLGAVRELKADNDAKDEQIRQLTERVEQMQKVQQQLSLVEARLKRLENAQPPIST